MPQPTKQHEWIMSNVGKWNVDCAFNLDPSEPPKKVKAVDTVTAHGQFFTIARFEVADFFGMPFSGLATTGYCPATEQFQSTWIDTMSPYLYVFTGQLDPKGKVLEMSGRAPCPNSHELTDWRTREEHIDSKTRKFEMWMTMPGAGEIQLFTHIYKRA
jgi:hypothetical protein